MLLYSISTDALILRAELALRDSQELTMTLLASVRDLHNLRNRIIQERSEDQSLPAIAEAETERTG
jgi:hypothetical protein